MKPLTESTSRRYELDWLRVLAVLGVFLYHTARFFNLGDWHIKNAVRLPALELPLKIFEIWGMPLLFVISGAGIFASLSRRGAGSFVSSRVRRLFIPLLVGIFSHCAWQVYLERTSHGVFQGSFLDFLPQYFRGSYAFGGNFAWIGLHLWYLEVLFVFSLIFLPLFVFLSRGRGGRFLQKAAGFLAFPGGAYALAIPVMLLLALTRPDTPWTARMFGGWSLAAFVLFLGNGFILVSNERLYEGVRALRWPSLLLALGTTWILALEFSRSGEPVYATASYARTMALFGFCAWSWVLAAIGLAGQYLRRAGRFLGYAGEAALPFYILHQTVMLTIGFVVVRWPLPIFLKWAEIAAASLLVCLTLYEFLIRRSSVLRLLFGMNPRVRSVFAKQRNSPGTYPRVESVEISQ